MHAFSKDMKHEGGKNVNMCGMCGQGQIYTTTKDKLIHEINCMRMYKMDGVAVTESDFMCFFLFNFVH